MNGKTNKSGVPIWKEAVYDIPNQTNPEKLYDRIKTLEELYVSEDKFKKEDWEYLTTWMQDKKNKINHVTFRALTITSENISYITEILIKSKNIKTIIFNNYTIQNDKAFKDFCSLIGKIRNINRLRITINELSQHQVQQLQATIDPSINEVELIHEPIYIAMSDNSIYEQVTKKRRFVIGMKEINYIRDFDIGWCLFNALKNSPALEHVSIQSFALNPWSLPLAADAIAQNKSVTRIAIGTDGWDNHRSVFKNLIENDRITHIEIQATFGVTQYSISSLSKSLTRPSLTSMKIECDMQGDTFKDILNIPNITDLQVACGFRGSSNFPDLIAPNKHVTKLHIFGGSTKGFEKISTMLLGQLTKLALSHVTVKKFDICQVLKNSTSITELSVIEDGNGLTTYYNGPSHRYDNIADILEVNSTLKSLTLKVPLNDVKTFFEKFTAGLKNNKVLKHLDVHIIEDCFDMFAEALIENDTLTSLRLGGLEPLPNQLVKFSHAIATNKSLASLTAEGIGCWTEVLSVLKTNNSLQKLNLTTALGAVPNEFFEKLDTVLQTNQSLTSLGLQKVPIPVHIQKVLQRNNLAYHQNIDRIYSLITMMRLRPEAFTSVLPLEIWVMIFKRIQLPGCRINFAEKFMEGLKTVS